MNKKLLLIAALTVGISCSIGALAACESGNSSQSGDSSVNTDTGNNDSAVNTPQDDGIYTVTFQSNGGSAVQSVDVTAGQSINLNSYVTENSDDSYYFYGWYLDKDCTERASTQFVPSSDVTLYAGWGTNQSYTLTFDSCGGSAVEAQEYFYYEYLAEPAEPTRPGYSFDGWYWDADYSKEFIFVGNTMVAGDLTVYAKWTELYTISFDTDGGSEVSSITGEKGTEVSAPEAPVRDGYVFDGWFADEECTQPYVFSTLTESCTVYAKWHALSNNIAITLNVNAPILGVELNPVVIIGTEGEDFADDEAVNLFTQAINSEIGYAGDPLFTFGGWAYDAEGTRLVGDVVPHSEGNLALYATWVQSSKYCIIYFMGQEECLGEGVYKGQGFDSETIAEIASFYGQSVTIFTNIDGTVVDITADTFERDMYLIPAVDFSDFEFVPNADSLGYTLTSYTGNGTDVEVPSIYNGAPVTAIGSGAFSGNTSVASVVLPDSVTSIGPGAFASCSSLTEVIGGQLTYVGQDAFLHTQVGYVDGGIVYLNDSCRTVIGYEGTSSSFTVPAKVIAIAEGAFAGNSAITSFTLASGSALTEVPANAFSGCTDLSTVNFSSARITAISAGAFEGCVSLKEISLPSTVRTIEEHAFSGCSSLVSISLNGVRSLGAYAFAGCAFTSVDWTGLSVSVIPEGLFSGCTSLTDVVLPEATASIGANTFENCTSLTTFTINAPDTSVLSTISAGAFDGCSSLRTVILFARLRNGNAVSFGENIFSGCTGDLVVYVADGSPAYDRTSRWYDSESDNMFSYVSIYSQEYAGVTFMAADLSSPTITASQKAVLLTASEDNAQLDVVSFLLANGVSAEDNTTLADEIVFSVDSITHITSDGGSADSTGSVVYPEITPVSAGVYDLSELGAYRVTIRATDRFGNSGFTVVTICVVK